MPNNARLVSSPPKFYEPFLDVLKGIAMLGVIWVHYYKAPNSILAAAANIGARCPQLFFIVSAFLTWRVIDQHNNGDSYYPFYKKRFIRIAPIFWLALLFALLLPVVTVNQHSIGDMALHIVFLNGLVPQWTDNIMHVEWYIADLALFYFLCPVLKKVAFNLKTSIITLLVTIVISSLSLMITNFFFAAQIESDTAFEMYFHTFFILNQLPVWMMGVVLYYIISSSEPVKLGGGIMGFISGNCFCFFI